MNSVKVSVVKTDSRTGYREIYNAVKHALDLIGGIEMLIKPCNLVLINPSWVAPPVEREAGCITTPEVPRALADMVNALDARAIIAESSAVGVDSEKVIRQSGYRQLREMGYEIVNLKARKDIVEIPVDNGKVFETVESWELVQQADVIISVSQVEDPRSN
jgi:uncharacterized protein (DUF362 family)